MPLLRARRAGVVLVAAAVLATGCQDAAPQTGPSTTVLPAVPDAVLVPDAPPVAVTPAPGWPTAPVVGGPRGASSLTRLQVPGAPSYTTADDRALVPWAAGFAAQVAALPLAAPPPAPFRAVSAPTVTGWAGDWAQVTTQAEVDAGAAAPATTSWTLYTDTADDLTLTSAQLLDADGQRWVTDQAARLSPGRPPHRGPDGELADVRLRPDGSLLLPLAGAGPAQALSVPADGVPALLSDRGAAAVAQLLSGAAPATAPDRGPAAPAPVDLPAAPPAPDCTRLACLALTFDDGPGPYTDQLLDELATAGAPATFFLVGRRIAGHEATVARMADAGHVIGNHTWDHPDLTTLTAGETTRQLDRTDRAVADVTGRTPTLVRPPYGAVDPAVLRLLGARGDVAVGWSDDTLDWQNRDVGQTTERALGLARRGGVVLMHDIHPTTVQAVPGIVAGLRAAGYTLVTVDQLLGPTPPTGVLLEHQVGVPGG